MRHASRYLLISPLLCLVPCAMVAAAEPLETVTVVGVAPLPVTDLSLDLVPANVQITSAEQLDRMQALDLTQYLNRTTGSVFINEAQSNPLQPDVQFRGFTASPLLGLPQGIAMYQDGVRINEAFGDTVNWALIPQFAIDTLTVSPGANPVFGMNALGGALSVQTKNGFTHPGARISVRGGAFSRTVAEALVGGKGGEQWGYFAGGSHFDEAGWREYSPSAVNEGFGNLRYRGAAGSVGLSLTRVSTDLIGNGPAPELLLEEDRDAVFTRPDQTQNELSMLNLNMDYRLAPGLQLNGVLYRRSSDIDTLNGDDTAFEECEDEPDLLCEEDGEPVLDALGEEIASSGEIDSATLNRSSTRQRSHGTLWQLNSIHRLAGRTNHLALGASYDRSEVAFRSSTELGALDGTRAALPGGVFVGEAFTDLHTITRSYGMFLTDTLELSDTVGLTLAARYGSIDVALDDRLGTELQGRHRFSRLNPAVGMTWRRSKALQFYASLGEASRAPSPAELTCADEEDPCRLPNAFLSDPPLKQVISRTLEAGLRGSTEYLSWNAAAFRSINRDDIIFISAGALTNEGYFANVGRTRRQGLELNLSGTAGEQLAWSASYSMLDATFEESFNVASAHNPAAIDDEIEVQPGDRLPGIPRHLVKLAVDYGISPQWQLGADWNYAAGQYLRGDEGNLTAPLSGYAVLNLRATYAVSERVHLFALLDNALNEQYATFGVYGEADEVLGEEYENSPRFVSPGAPRALWVGVKLGI